MLKFKKQHEKYTSITMSGFRQTCGAVPSQPKVVKSETRTVTQGGITETITTEVIETYNNGVPTRTTRTTTTTNRPTPGRGHTGTHSSSDYSPEVSKKSTDLIAKFEKLKMNSSQSRNNHGSKPDDSTKSNNHKSTKYDSSSDSDSDADDFEKDCLEQHNYYRTKHGVSKLKLSKSMCQFAKEWANKCADEDRMRHRPNNKNGENIFVKWSSNPSHTISGKEAVDSWYEEIKYHQFGAEPRTLKTGHFTQVVWKSSKELGMAQAKSRSGKIYVVANYYPPGNMIGSFAENVPAPK